MAELIVMVNGEHRVEVPVDGDLTQAAGIAERLWAATADNPDPTPEREPAGFSAGSSVQAERADAVYEATASADLRSTT